MEYFRVCFANRLSEAKLNNPKEYIGTVISFFGQIGLQVLFLSQIRYHNLNYQVKFYCFTSDLKLLNCWLKFQKNYL
uniref:Uncharacterized protein n=1 Tax=Pararge aegeria TaxID=116150 RepID=S4NWN8_9NEOP